MRAVRIAVLLLVTVATAGRTQTPAPIPIDWSQEDSARVAFLMTHGRAYASRPVIPWAWTGRWRPTRSSSRPGANDYSTAPGEALAAEKRREGHNFVYRSVATWEPEVFAFLDERLRR